MFCDPPVRKRQMLEKRGGAITRLWETINTPARPTVAVTWHRMATATSAAGGKACVPGSLRTCGARARAARNAAIENVYAHQYASALRRLSARGASGSPPVHSHSAAKIFPRCGFRLPLLCA